MEKALVFMLLLDVICDSLGVSVSENWYKAVLPGLCDAAELRTGCVCQKSSQSSVLWLLLIPSHLHQ